MSRKKGWWLDHAPALPLNEATHTAGGMDLYYRIGGSGPPLLLLHGGTQVGDVWNPLVDVFATHYTVIVPDIPGHGRSTPFEGEFSHIESARLLFSLLDELGHASAHGAGFSLGAWVLLHMMLQQPERIGASVLISSANRWLQAGRDRVKAWSWESLTPEGRQDGFADTGESPRPDDSWTRYET